MNPSLAPIGLQLEPGDFASFIAATRNIALTPFLGVPIGTPLPELHADMRTDEYRSLLEDSGASWTHWRGSEVVDGFGDLESEYAALREGLVVADRSERETVVAAGTEVVPLLQGLVLNDVFKLADAGSGQLNAAVNVKGRYVTELRLLHVPDLLLIDLEPGMIEDGALSHFKRQIINEDARLHDRSGRTAKLLIAGPDAPSWLTEYGDWMGRAPGVLGDYEGSWGTISDLEVIAQRLPTFGSPSWELIVDAEQASKLWTQASKKATPIGQKALELARLEAGVPRWGVELHEKIIPLEAGMSWMVAFDKGCYLGQEIIARLDTLGTPAKELRAIYLGDAPPPEDGTSVESDGKSVGEVLMAARSPAAGGTIAHAYIKRKFNELGALVQIEGAEGVIRNPGFALAENPII